MHRLPHGYAGSDQCPRGGSWWPSCPRSKGGSGLNANDGIANHVLEGDEPQDAHDQGDAKHDLTAEVVARIIDEERQQNTGSKGAYHAAHAAAGRELSALNGVVRDKRKQRAVGNVCNRIERIPQHVSRHEQDALDHVGSRGPRNVAQGTSNQQANGTRPYICEELVTTVLVGISVYHGTNDGVVDSIPNLNDQQQRCHKYAIDTHELGPIDNEEALESKAHVASKVAQSVGKNIFESEFTKAVTIDLFNFSHFPSPSVNSRIFAHALRVHRMSRTIACSP